MFVSPPKNFNAIPTWNTDSMFSESPMMPLLDFDMPYDTRQQPMQPIPPMPVTPIASQEFQVPPMIPVEPMPPIVDNVLYNQGWLTTQIGNIIKVEFLIGTGMWVDREGILREVGISYIVIEETGSNDIIMCDIYAIKFVRVYSDQTKCRT